MNEPIPDIMAGYFALVKGIKSIPLKKMAWLGGGANQNKLSIEPEDNDINEQYEYLKKYICIIDEALAKLPPYHASTPRQDMVRLKLNNIKEFILNPSKRGGLDGLRYCRLQLERFQIYYNRPLLSSRQLVEAIETIFDKGPKPNGQGPYNDKEEPSFSYDIPHVLQREVSQLDEKFTVSLDGTAPSYSKTVQLVCYLYDDQLPCVPPIGVHIPEKYPFTSPICSFEDHEYSSTTFLLTIQYGLTARIAMMPPLYSLTHVLNAWEMSVRQACAPQPVAVNDFNSIFGI